MEHVDVLIVGAGLSGIGAAWHIKKKCPRKSFAILEGRGAIGGTWDLFRYPGIRSDSDMYTMGYAFKPWTNPKAIADGPSILAYIRDAAHESGIDRKIRFHHWVKRAEWSTKDARWTVEAEFREPNGSHRSVRLTCNFLYMCSGYYRYSEGHLPDFAGKGHFKGHIVHPQHWPEDLDYAGKRIVVIGSGATAVTLVPELAKKASHVVMLQRSPTYVVSRPEGDAIADWLRAKLPGKTAYAITRWKNVLLGMFFFRLSRRQPEKIKQMILKGVTAELGPDYDVATHFTPRYNPWDQRLCLVPDADLFRSIREGRSSVVTDHIEAFTEKGLRLKSGQELDADIIVAATGLTLELLGGASFSVDGARVDFAQTLYYKGMMFAGVPNLIATFGYTNASWTLKADLTCEYACRLLNRMDAKGMRQATPMKRNPNVETVPFLDFSSGYVQRAIDRFPKQGAKSPWKLHMNYALDVMEIRYGRIEDGVMELSNPAPAEAAAVRERVAA